MYINNTGYTVKSLVLFTELHWREEKASGEKSCGNSVEATAGWMKNEVNRRKHGAILLLPPILYLNHVHTST